MNRIPKRKHLVDKVLMDFVLWGGQWVRRGDMYADADSIAESQIGKGPEAKSLGNKMGFWNDEYNHQLLQTDGVQWTCPACGHQEPILPGKPEHACLKCLSVHQIEWIEADHQQLSDAVERGRRGKRKRAVAWP